MYTYKRVALAADLLHRPSRFEFDVSAFFIRPQAHVFAFTKWMPADSAVQCTAHLPTYLPLLEPASLAQPEAGFVPVLQALVLPHI